jgi:hypothetical protein
MTDNATKTMEPSGPNRGRTTVRLATTIFMLGGAAIAGGLFANVDSKSHLGAYIAGAGEITSIGALYVLIRNEQKTQGLLRKESGGN